MATRFYESWKINMAWRTFGTGSANVLPMTDKEKKEVDKKVKIPFGFSLEGVKLANPELTNDDEDDKV